ncbi:MAG: hypothetical protein HYS17_09830 [Micavibrio aeruginosavorus]|uniref:DUF676 domain-containing protein n=1 Tax=Micavibrio aeruginosavorus TaxID=349221 RepID=A0A7T5R1E8_9BACT|nr:MAG: hypothetical protein HYS17_09830 [Micavibrio aeruginosavorus]
MINTPLPTLPGWSFWQDIHIGYEVKLQQNIRTGTTRIVDEHGRTIGGKQTEFLEPDTGGSDKPLVIIIPGLNNLKSNLRPLHQTLKNAGYQVINIEFPSNRRTTTEHALYLQALLDTLPGNKRDVSFITHSLGGLILRTALADGYELPGHLKVEHILMIAPPHDGSFLADRIYGIRWLRPLYNWVCGYVGYDLTREGARKLPLLNRSAGILVGGNGSRWGFNPLAGEDNDNQVAISSSKAVLMKDFLQIPGTHALMLHNPRTINAALEFIRYGTFNREENGKGNSLWWF